MKFKLDEQQLPDDVEEVEITAIKVEAGDKVTSGQVIMDVEADKTSISLTVDKAGKIDEVLVTIGEKVTVGEPLLELTAPATIEIELSKQDLPGNSEEAQVTDIPLEVGAEVKVGTVLCELEADKATVAIEAEEQGTIAKIKVAEGDKVEIGTVLMTLNPVQDTAAEETKNISSASSEQESEITIIGGGPGGYVAALEAAKQGADVTVIEKEELGGTCLNWGCIPTKALVRSAEVYTNLKEAEQFGCRAEEVDFEWAEIIERKNNIVTQLTNGISSLLDKHNIEVISGTAELVDETTVLAVKEDEKIVINTEEIILATGSQPVEIPIVEQGAEDYLLYSRQALDLDELPEEMVIIGGGVIGLEFAFIFSRLDVDVTVIEYLDEVLSFLDTDVIDEITAAAKEEGIDIYTGAEAQQITTTADEQALVKFKEAGNEKYITAEKVLMAVGRKPDLGGIEVEEVGVEIDENSGGIKVDEKMQTTIDNIYAIGDVTGKTQLAHAASHQGIVAVKNILGTEETMNYNAIPTAIFTAPEIASVGLTEAEAEAENKEIAVGKFPVAANGKALTLGETRGFIKIIADAKTDQVLGGAIIGPHATDLIAEITLAVNNELTTEEVIETIHAHPTSAESIHEAALAVRPEGALHYAE